MEVEVIREPNRKSEPEEMREWEISEVVNRKLKGLRKVVCC